MNRTNSTISENIYTQIEAHLADVTAEARLKGQQCGLHQDIIDIILQDYANTLQDIFTQTNMTPTYTQKILACPEWLQYMEQTGVMRGLLQDYKATLKTIEAIKKQYTAQHFRKLSNKDALKIFETYAKDNGGTAIAAFNALQYFGRTIEAAAQHAVIYLHVHSVIMLRQMFLTTNEDLLQIAPAKVPQNLQELLQEGNAQILKATAEHLQETEKKVRRRTGKTTKRKAHATAKAQTEPEILQPNIERAGIRRNMIDAIASEIMVTNQMEDIETPAPDKDNAMPLLLSIAQSTGVTNNYAMQALKYISFISTMRKPNSETEEFMNYRLTLGDCFKQATGNDNPNTREILGFCNALIFLHKHFIQLTEIRRKFKKNPKSGKKEFIGDFAAYKVFTPILHIAFSQEVDGEDAQADLTNIDISKKVVLSLDVHKAIVNGRRRAYVEDYYIQQPQRVWLTYQQMQTFATPDEIKFLAMLYNKSRKIELKKWDDTAQEDILAEVFQYKTRLKRCKQEDERLKLRESIRKNRNRDKDKLKQLFAKAKELGVLSSYECVPSTNGKDMVWKWKTNAYGGTQDTADIQEITEQ